MKISRLEWQKIRLAFWGFYTALAIILCISYIESSRNFLVSIFQIAVGCFFTSSAIVDLTQGYERGFFTDERRI